MKALEILCKWRSVFCGWQLGTRPITDPEAQAVRDHREVTMILRAEVTAISALLIEKGVFTKDEFEFRINFEAGWLSKQYEKRFPGMKATEIGIEYDAKVAAETMKGWRP